MHHHVMVLLCMTLKTRSNTQGVMTFMHMHNALHMGLKVKMRGVGGTSVFATTTSSTTIDKGDPAKEAILRTIIDYVHVDARLDVSCKPAASLLFVHAGGGTGKSWMAPEILKRLRGQHGNNVVKYVAPPGIAASNR